VGKNQASLFLGLNKKLSLRDSLMSRLKTARGDSGNPGEENSNKQCKAPEFERIALEYEKKNLVARSRKSLFEKGEFL